jgi:hypothetical protein
VNKALGERQGQIYGNTPGYADLDDLARAPRPCLDARIGWPIRALLLQCSDRNTVSTFVFYAKNCPKID